MDKLTGLVMFITGALIAGSAFNVELEIPETYHEALAGENFWFTTRIQSFMNDDRMDITLSYEVRSPDGTLYATKSETVAIETQASFVGNILLPKGLEPGLYNLFIKVNSTEGEAEAQGSFNIIKEPTETQFIIKFSLFDIFVEIPDKYKRVHAGDELLTSIKLVNVGSAGRIDVFLDYVITDAEGNSLIKKRETVAVETQANFIRTFDLPTHMEPGMYHIKARITYADGKYADSENMFEILEQEPFSWGFAVSIAGALAILGILVMFGIRHPPDMENYKIRREVRAIVRHKMKQKKP